jgi:hypothetical protein
METNETYNTQKNLAGKFITVDNTSQGETQTYLSSPAF